MQIILTSEFSNVRSKVIEALADRFYGKILIIDSASIDPKGAENSQAPRGGTAFSEYGRFARSVEIVDLLETGPVDLSEMDVIHFTGGDPFRLLRACLATGFQAAIEDRANDRPLSVVGSSAGAMVMGIDLAHAGILCSPRGLPHTSGFGWVDKLVMPHLDAKGPHGDAIRKHVLDNPDLNWLLLNDRDCDIRQVGPSFEEELEAQASFF